METRGTKERKDSLDSWSVVHVCTALAPLAALLCSVRERKHYNDSIELCSKVVPATMHIDIHLNLGCSAFCWKHAI